jgi:N-acylneuraminate cytidylyltransferase
MSESAYKTFEVEENMLHRIFRQGTDLDKSNFARQSYPTTYDANGYVDIVRSNLIAEKNLLHGNKVFPYITEASSEIDEKGDIEKVRYILQKHINNINELFKND